MPDKTFPYFVKLQVENTEFNGVANNEGKPKPIKSKFIDYTFWGELNIDDLNQDLLRLPHTRYSETKIDNLFGNCIIIVLYENIQDEHNVEIIINFFVEAIRKKYKVLSFQNIRFNDIYYELYKKFQKNEKKLDLEKRFKKIISKHEEYSLFKKTPLDLFKEIYSDIILNKKSIFDLREKYNTILGDLNNSINFSDDEELIKKGESEQVEFKSSLRFCMKEMRKNTELEYDVLKAICALTNKRGGKIYIGVNNNGELLGLTNDYNTFSDEKNSDKFLMHLANIIEQRIKPSVTHYLTINIPTINNKEICIINVKESLKPIYLEANGERHFVVREGTRSPKYSQEKIDEHIRIKKYMNSDYLVE